MGDNAANTGVIEMREMPTERQKSRRPTRDTVAFYILLIIAISIALIAILAPWIAPYDPTEQNIKERLASPSVAHPLGTDQFGRDILSRIIWGAKTTLIISVSTTLVAGGLGGFMGMFAGYKGGILDAGVKPLVDLLMAFPSLLLGLMVLAVMGPGTYNLIVAASLSLLPGFIRITRNLTLSIREREFIISARAVGGSDLRIVVFHILPNLRDDIMTVAIVWMAQVIRMESALSFIGIGVSPPTPSWGLMIREGFNFLYASPWLAVFPGMSIVFCIFVLSLLSDQVQERYIRTSRHG
jgi:peptide/nickel transport system permease protein